MTWHIYTILLKIICQLGVYHTITHKMIHQVCSPLIFGCSYLKCIFKKHISNFLDFLFYLKGVPCGDTNFCFLIENCGLPLHINFQKRSYYHRYSYSSPKNFKAKN